MKILKFVRKKSENSHAAETDQKQERIEKLKKWIKTRTFKPLLLELIKWKIIDIRRAIKYGKKLHFYGIRCIAGMYGQGKTVAMTKIGLEYREKYGDKINITSNFGFALQDFPIDSPEVLYAQYDKPTLFLWDEVQNDFPNTDKVFPKKLREALTLNRKGNGKKIYWCSQDHELVHKTIRRLTIETGEVRTLFGRYTRVKWYRQEDYLMKYSEVDINKKMKIRAIRTLKFVQTDYLRGLYNSFGINNGESITKNAINI